MKESRPKLPPLDVSIPFNIFVHRDVSQVHRIWQPVCANDDDDHPECDIKDFKDLSTGQLGQVGQNLYLSRWLIDLSTTSKSVYWLIWYLLSRNFGYDLDLNFSHFQNTFIPCFTMDSCQPLVHWNPLKKIFTSCLLGEKSSSIFQHQDVTGHRNKVVGFNAVFILIEAHWAWARHEVGV